MIYHVTHTTTYQYSEPVALCQNLAHLTPRPGPRQTSRDFNLDITPYPDAVSRLVLRPLSMTASRFPAQWPTAATADYPAVTGYDITSEGAFAPQPGQVCIFVAGGGLWSTPADLVRFGLGWRTLLPRSL